MCSNLGLLRQLCRVRLHVTLHHHRTVSLMTGVIILLSVRSSECKECGVVVGCSDWEEHSAACRRAQFRYMKMLNKYALNGANHS